MKQVNTNVVFTEGGEVVYAILFTGVMARRYIYAKRVSVSCPTDPEYIRIKKLDTDDTTEQYQSVIERTFRDIDVPAELGLNDPRIVQNPEMTNEILNAIDGCSERQ